MTDIPTLTGPIDLWATSAVPGSRIIYHTGTSAGGRVCRQAMALCDAGVVTLVRKRADKPHEFHYIAEKLRPKGQRPAPHIQRSRGRDWTPAERLRQAQTRATLNNPAPITLADNPWDGPDDL